MSFDVVAFGEAMLRLSVPKAHRLISTRRFDAHVGGTEANVMAALAQLGWKTGWLSAVPDHELGERVTRTLRSFGVNIEHVLKTPDARLGTYYFESGVMPRPGRVLYDRAGSAFSYLSPEFEADGSCAWLQNWSNAVSQAGLLHATGVTAALGADVLGVMDALAEAATSNGVPISFDVNYRASLWSPEEARPVLRGYVERSEIVFCSLRDGAILLEDKFYADTTRSVRERSEQLALAIGEHGPATVVVSMASQGILVNAPDGVFVQEAPSVEEVMDRVGAGDAMAAGILHGVLKKDSALGARLGSHLSGIALGQIGDLTQISASDMELGEMGAEAGLRIKR